MNLFSQSHAKITITPTNPKQCHGSISPAPDSNKYNNSNCPHFGSTIVCSCDSAPMGSVWSPSGHYHYRSSPLGPMVTSTW